VRHRRADRSHCSAQRGGAIVDEALDLAGAGDIRDDEVRTKSRSLELGTRGVERLTRASADRNVSTFGCESKRDRAPDSTASASHEGDLSGETQVHLRLIYPAKRFASRP
jgi:hypothetical protein